MACSLAARFAAAEGGVTLEIEQVDLGTKLMANGESLYTYNPLGQVSVLLLDDGQVVTETSTVLTWIQSQSTDHQFRCESESAEYFQMLRWLAFCATELHKQIFRVVFYPEATDEVKDRVRGLAPARFELLNHHLSDRDFLLGEHFTAADAYLTWFFVLAERAQVDPNAYPHLSAYAKRVFERPSIQSVLADDVGRLQS